MKKFKKTYIEITNTCNLDCAFCPKTSRKLQFMSKELFETILRQISGHSKDLYFHVMGEPLLHPRLGLFLDMCHEYGYRVSITTNGTLIDKVGEVLISKPALRKVSFSLHSFEANDYEYSMDVYLDRIFSFIGRARKDSELSISLRLWNLSEGGRNKNNKYVLQRIKDEFELDFTIEEKLTPCSGIKLAHRLFINQADVFEWPDTVREEIPGQAFCYGLRDQIAILVDGTVVPCCLDREGVVRLGNVKEQKFSDIVQSKRAQTIFDGFSGRQAVEELCRKCSYRTRFTK